MHNNHHTKIIKPIEKAKFENSGLHQEQKMMGDCNGNKILKL